MDLDDTLLIDDFNILESPIEHTKKMQTVTKPRAGRRGRKPSHIDSRAKLERSRQSARECRARKKLRYQYVEELVSSREKAIKELRIELDQYKEHCIKLDAGIIPNEINELVLNERHKDSPEHSLHADTLLPSSSQF